MSDYEEGLIAGQLQLIETVQNMIDSGLADVEGTLVGFLSKLKASQEARLSGNQYEADANADHITGQIPNV